MQGRPSLAVPLATSGQLLRLVVHRHKAKGESKGFEFMSYDNPQPAQMPIQATKRMSVDSGKRLRVELKTPTSERVVPFGWLRALWLMASRHGV